MTGARVGARVGGGVVGAQVQQSSSFSKVVPTQLSLPQRSPTPHSSSESQSPSPASRQGQVDVQHELSPSHLAGQPVQWVNDNEPSKI